MSVYISSDLVLDGSDGDFRPDAPLIGYRSVITFTNISADEEATGFPVTNLSNPTTSEVWAGTSTAAQYITLDLTTEDVADYFALAEHNLGSAGIACQLQGSDDGETWADVGEEIAPGNDSALLHRFEAATYRFWRLGLTSGSEAPTIGVFFLGQVLVLERNIYGGHTPINYSYDNVSSVGVSEAGQYLGAMARRANPSTTVSVKNLTAAWFRQKLDPFFREAVGNGDSRIRRSFFFAWRPSTYPDEVGYGWIPAGSAPKTVNQGKGLALMDADFSVQGTL